MPAFTHNFFQEVRKPSEVHGRLCAVGEYLSADAICRVEYRLEMFAYGDGDGAARF